MKYRIKCEVSGGTTGYAQSYLKKCGMEQVFCTFEEADTEADRLNKRMNGKYASATYRYTVEDYLTRDELLASHRYIGQEALDLD